MPEDAQLHALAVERRVLIHVRQYASELLPDPLRGVRRFDVGGDATPRRDAGLEPATEAQRGHDKALGPRAVEGLCIGFAQQVLHQHFEIVGLDDAQHQCALVMRGIGGFDVMHGIVAARQGEKGMTIVLERCARL